ncbi:MAG: Gfo/Idh/MocA family protein [Phycisphaerae bacterium]
MNRKSAKKDLLIGVIGTGSRGGLAMHAHNPAAGVRVAAICDIRPQMMDRFKERYKLPDLIRTTDHRELLARPEIGAVFITSPDHCHEEHAVAALEAGKAVYLEKPMAISVTGCDRILRTAYRTRGKLYLGHNMRHMSVILKMKEIIDSGAIGEVKAGWCRHFVAYGGDAYYKDWHAERSKSWSLLLQKAAHDIDVLHWLCGGYTRRVVGMGGLVLYDKIKDRHGRDEYGDAGWSTSHWPPMSQKGLNPVIDVEDISMMLMRLDNGVFCSYQQCHFTPDGWRNYTIIGTEGRVENFGDSPGETVVRVWDRMRYYNPYGDQQHYIEPVTGGHGGADPSIVAEFIRFVRDGGKMTTSPVAARYSVAAGYLAAKSLREGNKPQAVPPVPEAIVKYFERQMAR